MKNQWGLSLLSAMFALLLLTACQPIQPEGASQERGTPADTSVQAASNAPSELTGILWQWQQTGMNDDSVTTPADPASYTLEFSPGGRLQVQADCNGGRSSYTLEGNQLTIGPVALTRMACPAGSLDSVFVEQLGEVVSYLLDGDKLVLELKLDSGGMTFAPAAAASADAAVESTTAPTATATLTGTIMYLQRVALPAGAVIDVQLQDVSKMDVAATVVASQTITTSGENVPIAFELTYDPAQIDERSTYALSVRITIDGELRWINSERYAVLTHGAPTSGVEVMVQSAQ